MRPPLPKSTSPPSFTDENNATKPQPPDITFGLCGLKLGGSTRSSVRAPPPIPSRQQPKVVQSQPFSTSTADKQPSSDHNDISDGVEMKQHRPTIPPRQKLDQSSENSLPQGESVVKTVTPPAPAQKHPPPIPSRKLPISSNNVLPGEMVGSQAATSSKQSPDKQNTPASSTKRIPPTIPERKILPPNS